MSVILFYFTELKKELSWLQFKGVKLFIMLSDSRKNPEFIFKCSGYYYRCSTHGQQLLDALRMIPLSLTL